MQRRTIHFSGHVQGVGFRYSVQREAGGRAVTGFVRNLSDGRVEMVVEGSVSEIERVLAGIRERFAGFITHEVTETSPATGEFGDFGIRR